MRSRAENAARKGLRIMNERKRAKAARGLSEAHQTKVDRVHNRDCPAQHSFEADHCPHCLGQPLPARTA